MSESEAGWFHCGRCGNLFHAAAAPARRGACPSCGGDPVPEDGDEVEEHDGGAPVMVRRKRRRGMEDGHEKSKSRQRGSRKTARAVAIFSASWVLLLALVALVAKRMWPDVPIVQEEDLLANYAYFTSEDQRLLQDQLPGCLETLQQFLANPAPESRAAHVLGGTARIGELTRHQQNHMVLRSEGELELLHREVLHTPAGRAIETLWKIDDERSVEAVYFENEEGEWRIDWRNLVRFSTEPWPLFLAGVGAPEGEFRLLARERGGEGIGDDELGLVLYAPRADRPGETAAQSPGLTVSRESDIGRRILAALKAREQGLGAFGSKVAGADPAGMIRLRVRVSRHQEGDERVFRIEELPACHWLHFDGEGEPEEESR